MSHQSQPVALCWGTVLSHAVSEALCMHLHRHAYTMIAKSMELHAWSSIDGHACRLWRTSCHSLVTVLVLHGTRIAHVKAPAKAGNTVLKWMDGWIIMGGPAAGQGTQLHQTFMLEMAHLSAGSTAQRVKHEDGRVTWLCSTAFSTRETGALTCSHIPAHTSDSA